MIYVQILKEEYIATVWRLEKECFPDDPWSREMFESELNNPLSVFLTAVDDESDEVVGYGGVLFMYDTGHITNIAVGHAYRRKGIGRCILRLLTDVCRKCSMAEITLEVRSKNEKAKNLYLSEGFEVCGHRKRYYRDREDAVIMTKKLEG